MKFSEKLKQAMQQLSINQAQVVGMTGKSKGSISMYLNDKTVPSEQVQSDIAVSLGLAPDYFEQDENPVIFKPSKCEDGIQTLTVHEVAKLMHKHTNTIALGLQQGVFPWGYAIHTSEHRWSYFINAKRFAEIEGVTALRNDEIYHAVCDLEEKGKDELRMIERNYDKAVAFLESEE